MIYIKSDELENIKLDLPPPDKVGVYSVYPDTAGKMLSKIAKFKKVPDSIKYPICYKQTDIFSYEANFAGTDISSDFVLIGGPCSAESDVQVYETARFISSLGMNYFRAGCYKPRTNAYSFQGLERAGLELCRKACDEFGLKFVTEVKDLSNFDDVYEFSDVVQIGSKCMYDVGVLRAMGKSDKPVLLKRHFGATLVEFAQAADFIASQGNSNIALCERGIRTFESSTRFSLDSSGIEWMKQHVDLPIIGDPSHAMGYSYGVEGLSLAMMAQGVRGLIIEVHPNPKIAKSDASQQLNFEEFKKLKNKINKFKEILKDVL